MKMQQKLLDYLTENNVLPEISESTTRFFTIGYGGLKSFDELKDILDGNGITMLIDIRSKPYSRKWKKTDVSWNKKALQEYFSGRYNHMVEMGGLGYESNEYERWIKIAKIRINEIIDLSKMHKVALMCAEKDPNKCHRKLFAARALEELGFSVYHL
jgi:uncharacterized protein (DUF488 family)